MGTRSFVRGRRGMGGRQAGEMDVIGVGGKGDFAWLGA